MVLKSQRVISGFGFAKSMNISLLKNRTLNHIKDGKNTIKKCDFSYQSYAVFCLLYCPSKFIQFSFDVGFSVIYTIKNH